MGALETLANMSTAKPSAAYVKKNCKLLLKRHIFGARVAQAPEFN
jgi:hypothetical protein